MATHNIHNRWEDTWQKTWNPTARSIARTIVVSLMGRYKPDLDQLLIDYDTIANLLESKFEGDVEFYWVTIDGGTWLALDYCMLPSQRFCHIVVDLFHRRWVCMDKEVRYD